jgi:hypothetical protein
MVKRKGSRLILVLIGILFIIIISLIIISQFLSEIKKPVDKYPPIYPPPINPPVRGCHVDSKGVLFKDNYEGWTKNNENGWSDNVHGDFHSQAVLMSDNCYDGSQCILADSNYDDNYPQFSSCEQFPSGNYTFVSQMKIKCDSIDEELYLSISMPANTPDTNRYRCVINFLNDGSISVQDVSDVFSVDKIKCDKWFKFMIKTTDIGTMEIWLNDAFEGEYSCMFYHTAKPNGYLMMREGELMLDNTAVCSDDIADCYKSAFGEYKGNCENGLIAYYSFDVNAEDNSCNNYNAQVNGAKHITAGQKLGGGAYEFDGLNDGIITPVLIPERDFSVTLWINDYLNHTESVGRICVSDLNHEMGVFRYIDERIGWWTYPRGPNDKDTISPLITQTDTWYFVAVVHNESGGTNHIWINGANEGTTLTSSVRNGANFVIGNYYNQELFWNGSIDEVAIWNKALSLKEIQKLYNNGKGFNPTN